MFRNVLLIPFIISALSLSFISYSNTEKTVYSHGVILQYHHVNTTTPSVTSISPELFEQHLKLIKDEGFLVLPLDLLIQSIRLGIPFKQKVLSITFDDNYQSIYDNAFPLLKKRHWPFTIFVNPKTILNETNNNHLNLSWDQLKDMESNGATIANHTQNHFHLLARLENESEQNWKLRIINDIQSAQDELNTHIENAPTWLAYPYGEFNEDLKMLVNEIAFLGFSQQSGGINHTTNWQAIPRFPASGIYANLETLKLKMNSRPFEVLSENPINKIRYEGEKAPILELIVNKKDIRHQQLSCYFSGKKIYSEVIEHKDTLTIYAQLEGELPFGRSRYNCTAPAINGGYFWYSMPFVSTNDQGDFQD